MKQTVYLSIIVLLFLSGCTPSVSYNRYTETELKSDIPHEKVIIESEYNSKNRNLQIYLQETEFANEIERNVEVRKETRSSAPDVYFAVQFALVTTLTGWIGQNWIVGVIGGTIWTGGLYLIIPEKTSTTEKYGEWRNIGYDKEFPLKNENISLKIRNDELDYLALSKNEIMTDIDGVAQTIIDIKNGVLIDKNNSLWDIVEVEEEYYEVEIIHKESGSKQIIEIGPFKNIENYLIESIVSKVKFSVVDINSRFPLSNTLVRVNVPKDKIIIKQIERLLPRKTTLSKSSIEKLKNDWAKGYYTQSVTNGSVTIPLIQGLRYGFEFSHAKYYWYETKIEINKNQLEYDVLLSDIGSKVRNEKVTPKTTVIEKN